MTAFLRASRGACWQVCCSAQAAKYAKSRLFLSIKLANQGGAFIPPASQYILHRDKIEPALSADLGCGLSCCRGREI
jgi:hypothetical protein